MVENRKWISIVWATLAMTEEFFGGTKQESVTMTHNGNLVASNTLFDIVGYPAWDIWLDSREATVATTCPK